MSDDDFKPRLGRSRARGGKRARTYLGRVVAAVRRAGAKTGVRGSRFDGSRIGRGASIGRVLGSGDRHAGFRARRVTVKARLVKLAGTGASAARAHLHYIERDGVTRDGAPGQAYSAGEDTADGKAFVGRGQGDRHQFRFIVSAEDGDQYADLKPFVRRLMTQMEEDLGTKLDWVAVDHFNTGHPHSHIILRGKDDLGENLIIAREYIAHGMRERASALATLDLGPRTDREIEARLRRDLDAERLTPIDRRLVHDMDADHIVTSAGADPFQQSLRAGRLATLKKLGLADDLGGGRWQLGDGLEDTLRRMGERGDIIRTMQRELTANRLDRAIADRVIHEGGAMPPIVGRLVSRGIADELRDRHYLIVDGVDGRSHYIGIGKGDAVPPIGKSAIVRIEGRSGGVRETDHTIVAIAAANGGRYDIDAHLRYDPQASRAFAQTHVRRLEAMRRVMHSVERDLDGSWTIAPDHMARAAAFEMRQIADRPVTVETLSTVPLGRLMRADAATWLDRELVGKDPVPLAKAGFGEDVSAARKMRQQWLIEQDLAEEKGGHITYRPNLLATLQRRELLKVAGQLSDELRLPFAETKTSDRITGVLRRPVDLTSGRFALIEKSRDFTLVPWRPVLERQIGKPVSGVVRATGINWSFGRGRGGPSIS